MKNVFNIVRWVIGILFMTAGIYGIFEIPAFGLSCALFGLFLLPAVWKGLTKNVKLHPGVQWAVPALCFVLMCLTVPASGEVYSAEAQDTASKVTEEELTGEVPETESAENETETVKNEAENETEAAGEEIPTETPEVTVKEQKSDKLEVHFLDVGQGLAIYARCGDQNLIYDGGDRKTSSYVVSYLKDQGVTKLDYVISSHYDSDHVYGLIGCINAFDVGKVISADYVHDSQTYEKFVNAVESKGLTMEHPAVGTEYGFGNGSITILAPSAIDPDDANRNSVAMKLVNGTDSFIFVGDADSSSEKAMCESGIDLSCDVLVPSHHGSATGTSWDFLQETVPEYAVISCGKDNQYGHPDKDTMDKLEAMEIAVYRTDVQGTIVAESNGNEIVWNTDPCNDYTPGDEEDQGTQPQSSPGTPNNAVSEETPVTESAPAAEEQEEQVWISETGSKYHSKPNCGTMNPDKATQIPRSEAEKNYEACKRCMK